MPYVIELIGTSAHDLEKLRRTDQSKLPKVIRALQRIAENPKHPGLNSHEFISEKGPNNEDVWESYVENNTSAAWRVFWFYGPEPGVISVIAITRHP